jgi:ferric-dicitrate binding protein FerR (iron transport regulator)
MTYNKNHITAIISKNEYDACSPEELELLEQWYKSLDENATLDKLNSNNKDLIKKKTWEAITEEIDKADIEEAKIIEFKPARSLFYYVARIAAILVFVTGTYTAYNWFNKPQSVNKTQYISQLNNTAKPLKIILPDNSLIWLESKSAIKYPEHFSNTRTISLESGKVFFNVAHDTSKPFIVETEGGLKTTVLGTAFVVEKGSNSTSVKISVLRGKVQVSDNVTKYATLTRNQGVDVNTLTKTATILEVDSLHMTAWFKATVVMDNVTLKEVAASIKDNFGYNIQFSSPKLALKPCSITYNETDNIDVILTLLDKIYHTTHSISDSTVYIKVSKR